MRIAMEYIIAFIIVCGVQTYAFRGTNPVLFVFDIILVIILGGCLSSC